MSTKHHDDIPSLVKSFLDDVHQLTEVIDDLGNPFLEESKELRKYLALVWKM